jgi:hypothetical protein
VQRINKKSMSLFQSHIALLPNPIILSFSDTFSSRYLLAITVFNIVWHKKYYWVTYS